jgi:hypothetical protein
MQYALRNTASTPDPVTLEQLLHRLDAAAIVDRDPSTGGLRVASIVGVDELVDLLRTAGFDVKRHELTRLPSECCGGCGG